MRPEINQYIESHQDEMVQDLQRVIRTRSVIDTSAENMPYGKGCAQMLEQILEMCSAMGFHTVNVDNQCGYAEYGEGEEIIGIFSHFDVVAEGTGWEHDPFGGEIHNGAVWGRGALDNKGPGIASLYGLRAIKELNLPINRRIRIVFGIDEESGMRDIQYYLKKCGAPYAGFSPDAQFPVSFAERPNSQVYIKKTFEKPCDELPRLLEMHSNDTQNIADYCRAVVEAADEENARDIMARLARFAEKTAWKLTATCEGTRITFESHGLTGHPYTPRLAQNANSQLIMFLDRIGLKGEAGAIIHQFREKVGMEYYGESLGIDQEDESGWLTFANTNFDLDEKQFYAVFKMYRPVTYPIEEIVKKIEEAFSPLGIEIDKYKTSPGVLRDRSCPLIGILRKAYEEHTHLDSTPRAIGGTYSKYVPTICGFGAIFPWGTDWCHITNEQMAFSDQVLMSKIFGNAIYELATADFHGQPPVY